MNGWLTTVSVAPVLASPSLRSEQLTQLVLGEGAEILDEQGSMLHIRTQLDQYQGWIAAGYGVRLPLAEVLAWLDRAAWSEGALLADINGTAIRAPHRARVLLEGESSIRLPNGLAGEILGGDIRPWSDVIAKTLQEGPAEWAWREFAGTPYLWGGITGAGIDCSGLVQNTWLARGVVLPRDAHQQSGQGQVIDVNDMQPGDLLFFRSRDSERIGHVALLAADRVLVHSTIDVGGVVREPMAPGDRAHDLLARLVAVRRIA